jgi:NAD(P)-dependent dehydrogenase (short-subunit alcohol dehydrogenase family)
MKNFLVIGGTSGIGRATVELLSTHNRVYATYRRQEAEGGANVSYHPLDVMLDECALPWLPDTLHGLVYCPGSITLKPMNRIGVQEMMDDYRLQAVGALRVMQQALPALKKSGKASVVLFSTVAVQTGFPFHTLVSASKGAVEGMVRAWAAELAPTVRVNALAPSVTDTPLAEKILGNDEKKEASAGRHPLRRNGDAKEMAEAVAFLLEEGSGFMTGQILKIDGGISSIR